MATNKSIELPDSPRTGVFRALEKILKNDVTLKRVVRAWRTYSGEPVDKQPFGKTSCPSIILSRIPGPEGFWSPEAFTGDMHVLCLMQVSGTCEDDADNLYWAIQRAVYPTTQAAKLANVQALQAAGAHTGLITFSQPAFDPRSLDGQASEGMIVARGELKITVRNQF